MEDNKPKWYNKKELWGTIALIGLGGMQFPQHTAAYKAGLFCNGAVAIAISWFGVKQGYRSDNLPSGLTKTMDKLPTNLTGIKGEKYL